MNNQFNSIDHILKYSDHSQMKRHKTVCPRYQTYPYPIEKLKIFMSPYNGTVCSKCSGGKDEGMLLCFDCAKLCPDPDCKGGGSKAADKVACLHCLNWMKNLDDGYERDGFYVYLLQSGYVGMTYDPSRRQKEHEIQQQTERSVSKKINKRRDSNNPISDVDSYRSAEYRNNHAEYFDKRDESGLTRWDRDVLNHWRMFVPMVLK